MALEYMRTCAIIPDTHIPFEHKEYYDIMLQIMDDAYLQGMEEIVLLGDYLDFYGCNLHGKFPDIRWNLADEINAGKEKLEQLRNRYPKCKITYLEGNHEFRLERYIWANARELYGLVTLNELLNLEKLDIDMIPYHRRQLYQILGSNLHARHEPYAGSTHTAYGTAQKSMVDMIFGHTHRYQDVKVVEKSVGIERRAISGGWIGDERFKVFDYVKTKMDWAHCFNFVHVDSKLNWYNEPIHFEKGRAFYRDYIYTAN
jgi:UDP-2,3-diacylglucosamine pyrophosphatase LpxH